MLSFADRVWSPPGSRPHVLLAAPLDLAHYAAELTARSRDWWQRTRADDDGRGWDEVVQVVPTHYLHITLTWLDRPTNQVDPVDLDRLHEELVVRLAALPPAELTAGAAQVRSHALEIPVHPTPALRAVVAAAHAATTAVFGTDAVADPAAPWRPHLTAYYGRAFFDHAGLADALEQVIGPKPGAVRPPWALLVDQDTFAATGFQWDLASARTVRIGADLGSGVLPLTRRAR